MYNQKAIDNLLRIGGDELVLQVVDLYRQHVPQRINNLPELLESKNFADIERSAHSVKSSAGNLGLDEVLYAARDLEHAASQEAYAESKNALDELLSASQDAIKSLNQLEKKLKP